MAEQAYCELQFVCVQICILCRVGLRCAVASQRITQFCHVELSSREVWSCTFYYVSLVLHVACPNYELLHVVYVALLGMLHISMLWMAIQPYVLHDHLVSIHKALGSCCSQ